MELEEIEEKILGNLNLRNWRHIYKDAVEEEDGRMVFPEATFLCEDDEGKFIVKIAIGESLEKSIDESESIRKKVDTPAVFEVGRIADVNYLCIEYRDNCIDVERFDEKREVFGYEFFRRLYVEVMKFREVEWPENENVIKDTFFAFGFDDINKGDVRNYDPHAFLSHICPEYGSCEYPMFDFKMVFSHCDLFYRNVLVDSSSYKFNCLIDWDTSCILPDFGEFYIYFYEFQVQGRLLERSSLRWLSVFYTASVEYASDVLEYFEKSLYTEDFGHCLTGDSRNFMSFRCFREKHRRAYRYLRMFSLILKRSKLPW